MKYVCLILSALCIVLAYLLYESRLSVERLSEQQSLQRLEAAIIQALSSEEIRITIRLHCHTIRIQEHFGENYKWGIDVLGMSYEIGANYLILRNDIDGVSKSWFPDVDEHEEGGVGNSVLVKEEQYKLVLLNEDRVNKVVSRLEAVQSLCEKSS